MIWMFVFWDGWRVGLFDIMSIIVALCNAKVRIYFKAILLFQVFLSNANNLYIII